jgi:hypothetical protein
MSAYQWSDHCRQRTDFFGEISRDGIPLAGETSWAGSSRAKAK